MNLRLPMLVQLLAFSVYLSSCDYLFNSSGDWTDNQIAYREGDVIYLMCLDTGDTRKLVEPVWSMLRWSPDGQRLVYVGPDYSEQDWSIYLVDYNGENKRVVTLWERNGHIEPHPSGGQAPAWSPDGDKVAYNRYNDWGTNLEIYIVELDTSNGVRETRVTNNPFTDTLYDWSPDGSRLLFKSDFSLDSTFDDYGDLYTVNTDGSDKQRILEFNESFSGSSLRYSPDGNHIAFIGGARIDDTIHGIYIMNADGSDITRITDNDLNETSLSWSPDGSQLIFTTGASLGGGHIYTIDIDGGNLKQITRGETNCFFAEWRP